MTVTSVSTKMPSYWVEGREKTSWWWAHIWGDTPPPRLWNIVILTLWGSVLGSFPYFASSFLPGVLSTPVSSIPCRLPWSSIYISSPNLYSELQIPYPAATGPPHQDVSRLPAQGSSSRAPSLRERCYFSELQKVASQGPPIYHPLSCPSPPYLIQHTKPSWLHPLDDFQIHLCS